MPFARGRERRCRAAGLERTEGLKSGSQFTMKDVLKRLKKSQTDAFSSLPGQSLPRAVTSSAYISQ